MRGLRFTACLARLAIDSIQVTLAIPQRRAKVLVTRVERRYAHERPAGTRPLWLTDHPASGSVAADDPIGQEPGLLLQRALERADREAKTALLGELVPSLPDLLEPVELTRAHGFSQPACVAGNRNLVAHVGQDYAGSTLQTGRAAA